MKVFPYKQSFNIHDHSGHDISDLYVLPKYNTFKEEIFNYNHFNINAYKQASTKVNHYLKSYTVITLKPILDDRDRTQWINLLYEIPKDKPISFNHLLSLSLYTDYTDLSREFSSTFRPTQTYEPLSSIKKRNSSFYFMSKNLRETVQIYGRWRGDARHGEYAWKGPWCMSSCFFFYILISV